MEAIMNNRPAICEFFLEESVDLLLFNFSGGNQKKSLTFPVKAEDKPAKFKSSSSRYRY
jgi:hypothetical protein